MARSRTGRKVKATRAKPEAWKTVWGKPGIEAMLPAQELTSKRKSQHGDWLEQSIFAFDLKTLFHHRMDAKVHNLRPHQWEAIDMILTKISRICAGDPNYEDHWDDIAGYAYLGKAGHGQ